MAVPLPSFSPTFGGDSGPALSETGGGATINQGGLNVPAYPDFYNLAPVDADAQKPIISRQDQPAIYLIIGSLFVLALLKKKK